MGLRNETLIGSWSDENIYQIQIKGGSNFTQKSDRNDEVLSFSTCNPINPLKFTMPWFFSHPKTKGTYGSLSLSFRLGKPKYSESS